MLNYFSGTTLETQVVPVPEDVLNIPGRESSAEYELIFFAKNIPALGYQSFYISRESEESEIETDDSDTSISGNVSVQKNIYTIRREINIMR